MASSVVNSVTAWKQASPVVKQTLGAMQPATQVQRESLSAVNLADTVPARIGGSAVSVVCGGAKQSTKLWTSHCAAILPVASTLLLCYLYMSWCDKLGCYSLSNNAETCSRSRTPRPECSKSRRRIQEMLNMIQV